MNVLDLFSGIGGISLGLERAGMRTVAFCEVDAFCRAVLAERWPDVPCYDDVRTLTADRLAGDGIGRIDVIAGGFPCQDISHAGKGAGLAGARSGLWYEFHRLIAEIQPQYAFIENVSALRSRGLDEVLRSLAAIGYDAEWHCVPASAVGAPHRRDRIWIVAYPHGQSQQRLLPRGRTEGGAEAASEWLFDAVDAGGGGDSLRQPDVAHARRHPAQVPPEGGFAAVAIPQRHTWWEVEPSMGRVADGIPNRLDRLKALGNAVVPQIPQIFGEVMLRFSGDTDK